MEKSGERQEKERKSSVCAEGEAAVYVQKSSTWTASMYLAAG